MWTDVMPIAGGQIVWVVLEIGRQETDSRQVFESLEQDLVPLRRRGDDIIIKLDQVRSACEGKRACVGVLSDVPLADDDSDPRIVQRSEILRCAVGRRVVPDHDLPCPWRCATE